VSYRTDKRVKAAYNRLYYDARAEQLKAKRRARYRAKVLGQKASQP
jgi:hypothetical protein